MLKELKNLNFPGKKEDILFFLQSVIGNKSLTIEDIRLICSHAPGKYKLAVDSLVNYCSSFNWIECDSRVHLDETMQHLISSAEQMNDELINRTVNVLFESEIFKPDWFIYDFTREKFAFKNECLQLCFSSIRNVLVCQCFFIVERNPQTTFYINTRYENIIASHCKKGKTVITLKQLKKRLENNVQAGELAEKFVLEYEKKRLSNCSLSEKVRIISDIDVCAGYDIVSFDQVNSLEYNRFIEVKAISENEGFYWSNNEFHVARIKGSQYHLYLIDLNQVTEKGYDYEPFIITNPVKAIMESSDWLVEAQTYYIKKI